MARIRTKGTLEYVLSTIPVEQLAKVANNAPKGRIREQLSKEWANRARSKYGAVPLLLNYPRLMNALNE